MLFDMMPGMVDMEKMVKESSRFQFQSELGSRNLNRELKARGLYGSGAGLALVLHRLPHPPITKR
jgi:hypothetical protein